MNIGEPKGIIQIEPLEEPLPIVLPEPEPTPAPGPALDPRVPAGRGEAR